jgi:entericidin B
MRKLVLALLVAAPLIVACNTVAGAGKDVKATGQAIEKAADKAKGDKGN